MADKLSLSLFPREEIFFFFYEPFRKFRGERGREGDAAASFSDNREEFIIVV